MRALTTMLCYSCAFLTSAAARGALSQDCTTAAVVKEIRGTVLLRANASASPIKLNPKTDKGRRLCVGDQVRGNSGSVLRIGNGEISKEIRTSSTWYTIRSLSSPTSRTVRDFLENYGRIGGRERGNQIPVFSPAPHSVVLPQDFVIRWTPAAQLRVVTLVIEKPEGGELWRQDSVVGTRGSIVPTEARRALATYRASGGDGPLFLKLIDSYGNNHFVSFSLMSAAGEQSLKKDLSFWDAEPLPFIAHIGRASVFTRARMFADASEEYEEALRGAPESRDLLISTIAAHQRTGNIDRANELTKRLPIGTTVP